MVVVDGRARAAGRVWARVHGAVVGIDEVEQVAALEDARGWDHLVLLGPAGANARTAGAAFAALDELLVAAGPALLFGGVDLPGGYRTAYLDHATAAGEVAPAVDRRDAVLRALRAGDARALGPPMRVTASLFGERATKRLGQALAAAVGAGRYDGIRLATAAAGLLGPEKVELLLALEGATDEPDTPVADLADHLVDVLGSYPEPRRVQLLTDLWEHVLAARDAASHRDRARAFARAVGGTQPAEPTAWFRVAMRGRLEQLGDDHLRLAFERPAWITDHALEVAAREVAASTVLVRLARAERDGGFDAELAAAGPLVDRLAAEPDWQWSGPAAARLVTLAAEDANRGGRTPPDVRNPHLLQWPPAGRRDRLVGCGWEAAASIEAVNDAASWCRTMPLPTGPWARLAWQDEVTFTLDDARAAADGGWDWRFDGPTFGPGLTTRRRDDPAAAEDVLDGLCLARLADLLGDLAGTGPARLDTGRWRFGYELVEADAETEPFRPLVSSLTVAVAGAAQLRRLGAEPPAKPTSWAALVDGLLEVVRTGESAAPRIAYPPELAALDGTQLGSTGLQIVVPATAAEIVGWGTWMANCIGSYVPDVRSGRSFVFALARPGDDSDHPVHNLELVPSTGEAYVVGELKARFNNDPPDLVVDAVDALLARLAPPTRPWPPKEPPRERVRRVSSGQGRGAEVNRARRRAGQDRLATACSSVLAGLDRAALDVLVPAPDVATAATRLSRLGQSELRAAVVGSGAAFPGVLALAATDWDGEVAVELDVPAEAAALLGAAARHRSRAGEATLTVLALAEGSARLGASIAELAARGDAGLAPLLADGHQPHGLLVAALVRSAAGLGRADFRLPVDERGLVTTRPHTDVLDPAGPWARAWTVATRIGGRRVEQLRDELASAGDPTGRLGVVPAWIGDSWSRWVGRAAPALAAEAGREGSGWARLAALAGLESTGPARLDAIARRGADLALLVAANPSAGVATRRWLGRHDDPFVAAIAALDPAEQADAVDWVATLRHGPPPAREPDGWELAAPRGVRRRLAAALERRARTDTTLAAIVAHLTEDPTVLARLARHTDLRTRTVVAANDRTPELVLRALATDGQVLVRQAVAGRDRRLPAAVAELVAADTIAGVRTALASSPSAPVSVLEALLGDRSERVRDAARANPRLTGRVELLDAADPASPAERLEVLSTHERAAVRVRVAANPSTPGHVRARLGHLDPDPTVRAAASGG